MGWKPRHPDERIAHQRERQSLSGRLRRLVVYLRYHPWHALRPMVLPLIAVAIGVIVVALVI